MILNLSFTRLPVQLSLSEIQFLDLNINIRLIKVYTRIKWIRVSRMHESNGGYPSMLATADLQGSSVTQI
jgi:hypothetical protein